MVKKLSSSDYTLIFLSFAFMLHNSPYFGVKMPAMVYAAIIIVLFVYIFALFSKCKNPINYLLPVFAIYFLDLVFLQQGGGKDILRLLSGTMQVLILPLLAGYAIAKGNVKLAATLLFMFISIELVTYITSIYAESNMQGIVRMNPGALKDGDSDLYKFKCNQNVGDFNNVYGCSAMIPIVILVMKYRKQVFNGRLMRLVLIAFFVISVYFLFVSQFVTAMLCSLLMTMLFFLPQRISIAYFRRSIIIGLVGLLLMYSVIPVALHYLAENTESGIVAERLSGIEAMMTGTSSGSEDIDERQNVYLQSIETMLDTFLMGGWLFKKNIGGHSFILDHLALYGVVGTILLVNFYKWMLKYFYYPYKEEPWISYFLYGILGVSIFYMLNPSALYPQMTFCYPLSAFLINSRLKKKLM